MARSLVEDIVGKRRFKVQIEALDANRFTVFSKNVSELVAPNPRSQGASRFASELID